MDWCASAGAARCSSGARSTRRSELVTVAHHAFEAGRVAGRRHAASPLRVELDPRRSAAPSSASASSAPRASPWPRRRWSSVVAAASVRPKGSPRWRSSPRRSVASSAARRAVTNNGWRNHTDQVGQTGTRIAPDLYMACGICGAIQHWVGAMASKKILAINTDPEANMVTKADYAVIGDLHKVIPAITAEIRRRRA